MEREEPDNLDPAVLTAVCLPLEHATARRRDPDPAASICSFCGKGRPQVQALFAGPNVYICSECVALCADAVAGDDDPGAG